MKGLIWFQQDLRLSDNPSLISLSKNCSHAIMLFVINPAWFKTNAFHCRTLGYFREAFLYQSLRELNAELKKHSQKLVIKVGDPLQIIPRLCKKHGIDLVTVTEHSENTKQITQLKKKLPSKVIAGNSFSLFLRQQLKFDKNDFPTGFNAFDQHVQAHNLLPCIPINKPDSLPSILKENSDTWRRENFFHPLAFYHGGEDSAYMRLKEFFWKTAGLQQYEKSTLDIEGILSSSRLSAWLSLGCISPRSIAAELDKYEYRYGKSAASKALYVSLLRREFYQWKAIISNNESTSSIKNTKLSDAAMTHFQTWRNGKTPFPLVNACMKQLNHIGYLSNLGREIVANCLVHHFKLDWHFGAAYFTQQLIDHDMAINNAIWHSLALNTSFSTQSFEKRLEDYYVHHFDSRGKYTEKWLRITDKALQGF